MFNISRVGMSADRVGASAFAEQTEQRWTLKSEDLGE